MVPLYKDSTVASWKICWVQPKVLVLIINFFSLIFTRIKIEGERLSASQNERILGREGAWKQTKANKGGGGSELGNLEQMYFLNGTVKCEN